MRIHFKTYAVLMGASLIFDLVQIFLSRGNGILFVSGIAIFAITLGALFIQLTEEDSLRLKWTLWYLAPAALLMLGLVAGLTEMQNGLLASAGQAPIASAVLGKSTDYQSAAITHFWSMSFPFISAAIAVITQCVIDFRSK